MPLPSSLAVFCGSQQGRQGQYMQAAREIGERMAAHNIALVYGAGRVGIMGAVADAVIGNGGRAIGVIPDFLMKREAGNEALKELEVTDSMHSRKTRMFELSQGFVSLAGGLGTLDETVEIITWKQLGLHNKPIVIFSQDGYWDKFGEMIAHFTGEGFVYGDVGALYTVVDTVDALFEVLSATPASHQDTNADRL